MLIFLFFIIFYFFIYCMLRKASSTINVNKEEFLAQNEFSSIERIYESVTSIYYSAIKRGDNYLISYMKEYMPSMNNVNLLAKEMKGRHYHKGVLVSLSQPQQSLIEYGKKNSIDVISVVGVAKPVTINVGTDNAIKEYEKYKEENPIQEPQKSFWENLFKKPDRL